MPTTTQILVLLLGALAVVSGCEPVPRARKSSDPAHHKGFVDRVYVAQDGSTSKYVVFIPHDYDPKHPYPAILFLHGLGQSGHDGRAQVERGLASAIRSGEQTFPFVAIFPQSQQKTWQANSEDGQRAMAILDEVQQDYNLDCCQIFLTGQPFVLLHDSVPDSCFQWQGQQDTTGLRCGLGIDCNVEACGVNLRAKSLERQGIVDRCTLPA